MEPEDVSRLMFENVRRLLAAKEPPWSQAELGRQMGLSPPSVSRLFSMKHSPSVELVAKIAIALNVPVSELFISVPTAPEPARPMGKRK